MTMDVEHSCQLELCKNPKNGFKNTKNGYFYLKNSWIPKRFGCDMFDFCHTTDFPKI